ncbi:flavoprotein [Micromonospora sp. WMMD558]|uniref:flavoprotein n=1 Tax=unclassified Micromonospora TaxID=2617518 RepID=UPI0012B4EED1|nr:flavoprotein [Micromonospora sp. WMMC415]QGN47657.1 flavoprotein [Micromonospora sp. WMMC415]
MPATSRPPVLHLVVGAAEPAAQLRSFITACQQLGWEVHLVATPDAFDVIDPDAAADLTHHPVHTDEQVTELPPAEAYAVAPAGFDLVNRWAYGFNDNLALRLLNEATSIGLPVVAVPVPDPALARHPAFVENLERLRHWGVLVTAPAEPADRAPWRAAVRVIAEWTRFARMPVQPTAVPEQPGGDRPRSADDLALQSG